MSLQVSDFPEQIREALARGEETVLFVISCTSRAAEGITVTTSTSNPADLLSYRADVTLANIQKAGNASVSHYFGNRIAAAKIMRLHETTGARQIPLFTIEITGKADADGAITTTAALTVAEPVTDIPQVRTAGDMTLTKCRDLLRGRS